MTVLMNAAGWPRKAVGRLRNRDAISFAIASLSLAVAAFLAMSTPTQAQTRIAGTKHNLTPSGPGAVRAAEPAGTCVFCHTPHNAKPTRALWNRELPAVTYQLYASSTLKAQLNQPNGSSRLCLSCHDGILALGNLRISPKGAPITLGSLTGAGSLGTDLSDDHPVSFVYDSSLAYNRGGLADPLALPPAIRLDDARQLQCTSCHDPHEDRRPKFLRLENRFGGLCTACHRPPNWGGSTHAVSSATWNGAGTSPWSAGAYPTVAENACLSCHRPHAAAHPQRLLAQDMESANCTICHGGTVAAKNIEVEFFKPFRHPIEDVQWVHDPNEDPLSMQRHVTCVDCHNPHAATAALGVPPGVSGRLRGVPGITLGGTSIAEASFEYEVCFKCHGLREPATAGIMRQGGTRNMRLKIDPAGRSYHPLAAPGTNAIILGLEPGYTASSLINCTSCHNNDAWTSAGTSPAGPHGSRYEPILGWQYETVYPTAESYQSYALCYQCHNRNFLINDQAGTFHHNTHVVVQQAPCAACHDAHGSRQNAHLIDFMLRDRNGNILVSPSSVQGRLEYLSLGAGRGECYLQCHGVNHEPKSYP
jgi:predicted CXXCH cytochrome family protein